MSGQTASTTGVLVRTAERPGDLGWVVMAHGELYAAEFGWDTSFDALVARIVADFAGAHDPAREAGWIAEVDGVRAGCVFCVASGEPGTAKLRILLVDPAVRGRGVGALLVRTCLEFARGAGYRRVVLWTNDVLLAARRLYESVGFRLVASERHHSWGADLVGETWVLEL